VSHRLSEASGLGVTVYGVNRGQRSRKEVTVQAVASDSRALAVSGVSDYEYSHNRVLAKLGYSWQTPTSNVGLSVTTPSLAVFGRGKAGYTLFTAGIDAEGDGRVDLPTLSTEAAKKLAIADITQAFRDGMLQHRIAERVPLAEIARANELVEQGGSNGCVVVTIDA